MRKNDIFDGFEYGAKYEDIEASLRNGNSDRDTSKKKKFRLLVSFGVVIAFFSVGLTCAFVIASNMSKIQNYSHDILNEVDVPRRFSFKNIEYYLTSKIENNEYIRDDVVAYVAPSTDVAYITLINDPYFNERQEKAGIIIVPNIRICMRIYSVEGYSSSKCLILETDIGNFLYLAH